MKLKGKVVLITGGGRGIGKTIARVFSEQGANLMLVARSAGELAATKVELDKGPGKVEVFSGDVSRKEDVKALVKKTIDAFGTIDVLVNAAGVYGSIGLVSDVDFEKWKEAFAVNLFGTVNVIQEALPIFMKRKQGKIINFSGGGDGPMPNFSGYNASKVAVVRFTETLAEEVRAYGITANAIAPGAVNTEFLENALSAGEAIVGKERYAKLLRQKKEGGVPPEKAAELCLFLASGDSGILSGKLLSAVWDDWKNWDAAKIKELMSSNKLTMRRVP